MPKKQQPKPWVVVGMGLEGMGLSDDESVFEVVDKANAYKVARLIGFFGSQSHIYPKGWYPEFNEAGDLT